MTDELIYTVWLADGQSWRVLSQWATWREAIWCYSRLQLDGETVELSKTGSKHDEKIRAGKHRPPRRV